jgi:NADPH:quinone reductase-like Zn-dependent oxidoreductase
MQGWITDPSGEAGLRLAQDLPEPEPAAGEAVVAVKAYSINRGELGLLRTRPDGFRPGQDIAGVVVQPAASGGPGPGTRVAGIVDWHGWAERVAAPVNFLAPIADNVSYAQAATLGVAGLTALRAVRLGGSIVGRRVLVTGATGGVGQFGVQIAAAAGAHVTAAVSSEARVEEALALGAHTVLTSLDGDDIGPFYLVLEGVGGPMLAAALRHMSPGGMVALYGTVGGRSEIGLADFRRRAGVRIAPLFLDNEPGSRIGDELAVMADMIAAGSLRPLIGLSLDWQRTREAVAALAARDVRGKAVLTLD